MLAADHYPDIHPDASMSNHELLEVHHGKISLRGAKADYSYPTVKLPYAFAKLAGLPTRVYQTVHDGALAFLVVASPFGSTIEKRARKSENASKDCKSSAFTRRRSPVRIRPSPLNF